MSSSLQKMKDRSNFSAGGIKPTASLKPSKTLTPISEKENPAGTCKGKENPRSNSRLRDSTLSQKPQVRQLPIPPIDKPQVVVSGKDGESKVRWSTSSVPRGRSSSPSDFARILSDFRKDRMPRVSVSDQSSKTVERRNVGRVNLVGSSKGNSTNESRVSERSQQKKASLSSNSKESSKILNRFRDVGTDSPKTEKNALNGLGHKKESHLVVKATQKNTGVVTAQSHSKRDAKLVENCEDKCYLDLNLKVRSDVSNSLSVIADCKEKPNLGLKSKDKVSDYGCGPNKVFERSKSTGFAGVNLKGQNSKASNEVGTLGSSKEKRISEEDKGVRVATKYPSKLHEKLAFLEGKVKRIASDIKRTKDMLETNNPDGSKTIISDIQDKILGIEKAMGHVINDNNSSLVMSETVDNDGLQSKCLGKSESNQIGQLKNSIKGLNHEEEPEARLVRHHKLLKDWTSSDASLSSSQSGQLRHLEVKGDADARLEEVLLSPMEDNPIAVEFLASLQKDQNKKQARGDYVALEYHEAKEMDGAETTAEQDNVDAFVGGNADKERCLTSDEFIENFDDQENIPTFTVYEEIEEVAVDQVHEIGQRASTGGWFVSDDQSILLAHEDGSCSFYDITNSEEKAEYKPPAGLSPNLWGDCWLIRASDSDGCSGKYVVAASSGNALDSGFCSWDFYNKDVRAFHVEDATLASSRTVLGSLPKTNSYRQNASTTMIVPENRQWWYRPCSQLLVSTASSQKVVKVYDIRDGEEVMQWEVQKPVTVMDYSSPLQWRNRGRVVIAETEAVSLWDVNSLTPKALLSIPSNGRRISALHVNNTDAELGGGVRRRASSSEVEGNDGVFCTQDSINVLDFRLPSGVGLKVSKHGMNVQSIFSRGDSIFLGCTDGRLTTTIGKTQSRIQHYSLRKGTLLSTYSLPESNAHIHYTAISQVWGNSNFVMGVCGLGLFVFDMLQDEESSSSSSSAVDCVKTQHVKDVVGPNDLYSPSFDYLSSRVLVISRDRPAFWRYLM